MRAATGEETVDAPRTVTAGRVIPNSLRAPTYQHESVSEAVDLATVVSLLDDECARAILVATSTAAMSATELDDHLDASLSTVYRRLERLDDAGLVVEETRPRADGHHDTVYSADLDEFTVSLADGELDCELHRRREDVAGRLARRWEDLKG